MLMDYLSCCCLLFSTQLLFLLLMLLETNTIYGDMPPQSQPQQHYWETPYSQPYFDNSSRREVTAIVGQAAQMHCRVRNLGDRAVSWIRKRDLHILTVGIITYTNDQRFQSLHTEGSDEWTLRISSPQPRDSGTYECQVSTEPKISQGFRLNVVVSRAKILGNTEIFIKSGNNINLTCLATQSPVPPSFIYWYKGKRVINYAQRDGINVITERSTRTSKLIITQATSADSGNYTCAPSSSVSASVVVHVINGEHPAAMQHGNSSANRLTFATTTTSLLLRYGLVYWLLRQTLAATWSAIVTAIAGVVTAVATAIKTDGADYGGGGVVVGVGKRVVKKIKIQQQRVVRIAGSNAGITTSSSCSSTVCTTAILSQNYALQLPLLPLTILLQAVVTTTTTTTADCCCFHYYCPLCLPALGVVLKRLALEIMLKQQQQQQHYDCHHHHHCCCHRHHQQHDYYFYCHHQYHHYHGLLSGIAFNR